MDAKTRAAQLSEAKKQSGKGGASKGPLPDRTVIDEDLITSAVKEERMTGSDTVLASELEAEVDLHALETLSLSFSNILKIDNLQGMERLVKLQLDNNHIEKIEGLEHLVNLQWLDLSFNKIKKVEGLSSLSKLTDLSLFSNELEKIEGLESLRNLHVLSIGNNRIKSLEEIKALRQFRSLRLLNVKGNPVCNEHNYQITVLAFLPQLKYLDYELIEPSAVAHARDKLLDQLHVIEEAEQQQAVAEAESKKKAQDAVVAKAANVDGVQSFFDTLLREDSENPKLRILPDYDKVIANYRVLFQRTIEDFLPQMFTKHTEKEEEKKMFERALEEARKINVRESIAKIDEFDSRRKKAFALYSDSITNGNPEPAVLEQLNEQVQTLYDDLMDLEMLLVEQTNDIISTFEDSYSALATSNVNRIQNAFRCLEDVANHYVDALQELVATLTVKSASEHFEAPPEVNAFLADKDTVKSAVTTSHDNHLNRIVAKSDELQDREDKEAKGLVRGYKQSEYERNRHRVSEIFELVERHKKLIREKLEEEIGDQ